MNVLREKQARQFVWVQAPTEAYAYVLRTKEEVLGTLRWEQSIGSCAIAEALDGGWKFTRKGVFHHRIYIQTMEEHDEVAVFTYGRKKSVLQCANGQSFFWYPAGRQLSHWTWKSTLDQPLVQVKIVQVRDRSEARVELEDYARTIPELSLLLLLGWYIINT